MSDRRNDQTDAQSDVPERIGPYQVKGSLGKGGMGEVYRGYDDRLARSVALKRVLTTEADSTKFRRRLRREARTVAQLNHSSIVQVYDWVETKEFDWLVMELVDGKSLSELAGEGKLPMDRVVDIAIGIADGLAAAHQAGIIHRDLKLGNVMVSKGGVKILDFGIAKPTRPGDIGQTEITREGAVVGTASSMSPEQAQGLPIDHRSDLFSFGTLLYELLTGVSPFRGHDMLQTILRIYSVEQMPVVERNSDVPQRLSLLIDYLLAKEPENRPPDAESVADELRAIATELRGGDSQTGMRRPLFTTASLEATLAGGAPTPMPPSRVPAPAQPPAGAPQTGAHQTGVPATGVPPTGAPQTNAPPTGAHQTGTFAPSMMGTGADSQTFYGPAPTAFRLWIGVLATLLVAAVAWGIYQGRSEPVSTEPVPTSTAPDSNSDLRPDRIVVLPFSNRTEKEEFDSLGLVISDWLTQGLSLSRQLEVVPMEVSIRAVRFASQQGGLEGAVDLSAVAQDTGARIVISGAYYLDAQELILRGLITDVAEDTVITGLDPMRTPTDQPIGVLEEFEQSVRAKVATHFDSQLATLGGLANSPPTYEAYEAYVRGLDRFRELDMQGAIELLLKAAELAPEFAMPRLMAATAYLNLAQYEEMTPILEELHQQRDDLAPLDRYFLDWLKAERRGDYVAAARVAGRASALAPLSPWEQTRGIDSLKANLPHQGLEALRPLDPEHGVLRGWIPHFEFLTLAFHLTGDHEGELEAARYGRRIYPRSIICLHAEARALAALGRVDEALELFDKSSSMSQEMLISPGMAMMVTASELRAHGHSEAARGAMEKLLAWYENGSGTQPWPPNERLLHTATLLVLGRHDEAVDMARRMYVESPDSIDHMGLLGVAAAAIDDIPTSEAQLKALGEIQQPYLFGRDFYWRSVIHAWQGDHAKAIDVFRQAEARGLSFIWPQIHPHVDPFWLPLRGNDSFADAIRPRG